MFFWSLLASLHPCNNNHPNRVSTYKQYFDELNINGFNFGKGFKCIGVHKFNDMKKLSFNIFEVTFYQDQDNWRHKLIPIEISKNTSDRVIDLGIYKNRFILIKKLDVFFGDHIKRIVCRQCLSSYTRKKCY